ncbi:hypothetical protein FNJ62_31290, partial [Streptomyces benahoarensis]
MPANNRRRLLSLAGLVTSVQTAVVLLSARAVAAPDPKPSDNPCDLIRGPAQDYCPGSYTHLRAHETLMN